MLDIKEEIDKALDLLFQLHKHQHKKVKLIEKNKTIYLQVVLFRIPFGAPRRRKYLKLCHPLFGDDPEICLFVPNRKTGVQYKKTTDEFIDFCVDYYTDLLEKHKVKGVSTIMPLKQLKSEYGTYDLKRKLVQRFDLFLCKNSLLYNSRFVSSLGKIFKAANKEPLGIGFPKEDVAFDPEFQKNIDRAIYSSSFYISRFSDNYSIPIGSLSNSKTELKDNLTTVLNQIFTNNIIPGGIKNVRAINLWPSQSKSIPLYISTEVPLDMKKPRTRSKKRRLRGVEGELSSQPGKKVFVMPSGEVFVTNLDSRTKEPEFHDSGDEESFEDESGDEEEQENTKEIFKRPSKKIKNSEESESEDDFEIEKKEAKLMKVKRKAETNMSSNQNPPQKKARENLKTTGKKHGINEPKKKKGGRLKRRMSKNLKK